MPKKIPLFVFALTLFATAVAGRARAQPDWSSNSATPQKPGDAQVRQSGVRAPKVETRRPAGTEIQFELASGKTVDGWLLAVCGDSVVYRSTKGDSATVAVADLCLVRLVKHGSFKRVAISTLVAGTAGALLGFMQGDDPPGWFSMTAEEKALLFGLGLAVSTFEIAGVVEIGRATDVEVPLAAHSIDKRSEILSAIAAGTYHFPRPLNGSVSLKFLQLSQHRTTPSAELRLECPVFTPVLGLGVVLGKSRWTPLDRHVFAGRFEFAVEEKKERVDYWGPYFFVTGQPTRRLIPWFSLGMCFGSWHRWSYSRYEILSEEGGSEQVRSDFNETSESLVIVNYEAGVRFALRSWLQANLGFGLFLGDVTADGAPYTVTLGFQTRLPL
ncbi:MAG: hypothetical protein GXO73_09450 [Calditrichaeota bacterium]|nr:hypothetical protein [Calditrichota bacterium]